METMKRWTQIFKALANLNRLGIIKLLSGSKPMHVTDISAELGISLKATSKHLILLHNLDVLSAKGERGHIYYSLNHSTPKDLLDAIRLFT